MHLFFAMAADKFPDEWSKVPFFTQTDNHILYFELFNQYKEKRMNDICNLTPFHKLTYKKAVPDDYTGTFYDYIMNSLINGR